MTSSILQLIQEELERVLENSPEQRIFPETEELNKKTATEESKSRKVPPKREEPNQKSERLEDTTSSKQISLATLKVQKRPKVQKRRKKGEQENTVLPSPKPSTHPFFPVWQTYNEAYQDRSLFGYTVSQRLNIIFAKTSETSGLCGLVVNDFMSDLYPKLAPWIVACGEPKGIAMWRTNLVQIAEELCDLPLERAVQELQERAMSEGLPLGVRQSEELIVWVQWNRST